MPPLQLQSLFFTFRFLLFLAVNLIVVNFVLVNSAVVNFVVVNCWWVAGDGWWLESVFSDSLCPFLNF